MRVKSQLFSLILFLMPFISYNLILKEKDMTSTIKIDYVDIYISTFSRVECKDFYDYFEKINHAELGGEDAKAFVEMILNLKEIDSTFSEKVDTRAKIELVINGGIKHICLGLNSLKIENTCYQTTDSLINLMSKLDEGG